jgi:hypothetical protein
MELPGNMMTPVVCLLTFGNQYTFTDDLSHFQLFTERVKKEFAGIPNVEIIVRDEGNLFVSLTYLI